MSEKNKPKRPSIPPLKNGKPKKGISFYWIYALLAITFIAINYMNFSGEIPDITWQEFENKMLLKKDVEKIVIVNKEFAEVFIKKESLSKPDYSKVKEKGTYNKTPNPGPHYRLKFVDVDDFLKKVEKAEDQIIARDTVGITDPLKKQEIINNSRLVIIPETRRNWTGDILSWVLPFLFIIVLWFILMRVMNRGAGGGNQIFNIGKSRAQLHDKGSNNITVNFNDVAGLEEAKVEIMEIVDFLKNPKKYTQLGGKIPKGVLLVGPPGTGKTLLAKAVAGEAKVPFFSISGSDFVEMFVGVGASRVRDLFRNAKEKAPCIIFIDEIDAIGRARGKNPVTGANDERENTLNQLLTEMDGFQTNAGVIILAATNRADILDRALLRAGRFDRQIYVELPDLNERKAIFAVHTKALKYNKEEVSLDFLAKQTPGFSGADIANVCNEAALIAARKGKQLIEKQDFIDAVDRIVGGLEKRNKIISAHEKKVIAFHEAGHATVSWKLEHANPLIKVTIIPRGKALGAAWYLPEERQITTFDQMFDEITSALGGRAAEEIMFGKVSTGALNDLEKVTKQAYAMVVYFGLNQQIGNISYYDSTGQSEFAFTKPFSEKTAEIIDVEVKKIVEAAYERAKQVLMENKQGLIQLAEVLLEKEVIFREDLEKIFGPRPFEKEESLSEAPTNENETVVLPEESDILPSDNSTDTSEPNS